MNSTAGLDDNSLKISVIHCNGDDLEHVRHLGPEIRSHAGSITVAEAADLPGRWHLAIFHSDGRIQAFGIGQRTKRVSDLDARFNLLCSRRLSYPEDSSRYWSTLGRVLRDGRQSGTLSPGLVDSFLTLFARSNSAEAQDIANYRAWIEAQSLSGDQARQLGLEKDVLLTLFDIAKLDKEVLTQWSSEGFTDGSTFLDGLSNEMTSVVTRPQDMHIEDSGGGHESGSRVANLNTPKAARSALDINREVRALRAVGIDPFPRDQGQSILEDEIIISDMFRTPGLTYDPTGGRYTQWHRFQNRTASQVLHIMYVNRGRVENDLGVDLVYYNESHESYVCVQYKVMEGHRRHGWEYRPNRSLRKELQRMEKLDADTGEPNSWFDRRLYPYAGFVKLCQQEAIRPASSQMTEGMYLTASQTRALLKDLDMRPTGSGKTLHRGSVRRHLSNSVFVELVKAGHVGSVDQGFESVSRLLRKAQENGRCVVVATHKQGRHAV